MTRSQQVVDSESGRRHGPQSKPLSLVEGTFPWENTILGESMWFSWPTADLDCWGSCTTAANSLDRITIRISWTASIPRRWGMLENGSTVSCNYPPSTLLWRKLSSNPNQSRLSSSKEPPSECPARKVLFLSKTNEYQVNWGKRDCQPEDVEGSVPRQGISVLCQKYVERFCFHPLELHRRNLHDNGH